MTYLSRFPALLALAAAALAQQPPTSERDLRLEKGTPADRRPADFKVPRSYALIIGINHYKNLREESQLAFPEEDAAAIYTALISQEAGRFDAGNVHRLIGAQATLANIRRELEQWLPSVSRDDDRVLVYFAGHGFVSPEDGRGYLAPYDIDPRNIAGTAYSMDDLGQVFGARIKAKWRVLMTDACHSGAIFPATDPDTRAINAKLQNIHPSVFSLTASTDREVSYEDPRWGGGHGVFTYFVIKGLEGEADTSCDGLVTARELSEYVHTNVRRETKEQQNPTSERGSFDSDMVLAYNPARACTGQPPPSTVGTLIIEVDKDGVEVSVDDVVVGIVNKGVPLQLPGLKPGKHIVRGVRMGYEPYGPTEQLVYPGQDLTVTMRLDIPIRPKKKAAVDLYEKGLHHYTTGNESNYRAAVKEFEAALAMEPSYSQAALYLGSTYNALRDEGRADKYFRQAIEIDPDYIDAHTRYAGVLFDQANYDGAIRELNAVVRREPANFFAHYMLCDAFTRKQAYEEAVREGRESVRLAPSKGEAHFWLAEALRLSSHCDQAEPEYTRYLELTDFDSKLGGKIIYILGLGKKKHASLHDIWMSQRNQAWFGLCDCARMAKRWDDAIGQCRTALNYDRQDPFTNYGLAIALYNKYSSDANLGLMGAARQHFVAVIDYNADTVQAGNAKKYIKRIDDVLLLSH